jgi:hypothetical protein
MAGFLKGVVKALTLNPEPLMAGVLKGVVGVTAVTEESFVAW